MTTSLSTRNRDLLIVQEVLKGNKAAYEKIMRLYNQQLFRIGVAFLGTEEGVEDLMQNTYLKAYYHLNHFKADAAFNTWLVRIMINECKQHLRKKEKERMFLQQWQQGKPEQIDPGIQHTLMQKEIKQVLQQAILELPVKYRSVFILREVEQLSTEETAELLQLTRENVKVRLLRSKTMIRKHITSSIHTKELFSFYLTRCDRIVGNVMREIMKLEV